MNKPAQIGITGGIGSGKSIVCRIFACLHVPVYDADLRARQLMENDPELVRDLQELFGRQAYQKGKLNRKWIASFVFGKPERLKQLNQLVHPRVGRDYRNWAALQTAPYLLKEAALMFESGSNLEMDRVITVFAPEEIRIKRVRQRDPERSESQIRDIIARQLPEEERLAKADLILYNDDSRMVIPQVLEFDRLFRELSGR